MITRRITGSFDLAAGAYQELPIMLLHDSDDWAIMLNITQGSGVGNALLQPFASLDGVLRSDNVNPNINLGTTAKRHFVCGKMILATSTASPIVAPPYIGLRIDNPGSATANLQGTYTLIATRIG